MKLIIAGTRTLNPPVSFLNEVMKAFDLTPNEIFSGGAKGVDEAGENWASYYGRVVRMFRANWIKYGKVAGPIRNRKMADKADALLLIWDGRSRGSQNMRAVMMQLNKPVFEVVLRETMPPNPKEAA